MENRGIITVRSSNRNSDNSDPNPKNTRDKVVLELLETERKYVQDMEILQVEIYYLCNTISWLKKKQYNTELHA